MAVAFAIVMAFATLPTPLYGLYAKEDALTTFEITLVFTVYAIGVTLSLFLLGPISDWAGRRRVLLIGLSLEIVACALFLVWSGLPGLIAARFTTGIGVGMVAATATAYLNELHEQSGRTGDATALATLSNLGGFALGPLIAGLLAQFAPDPLVLPYLLFLGFLVAAAIAVEAVPETVPAQKRPAYRPQRIVVPRQGRRVYIAAALIAFVAFAVFSLFSSLVSTILNRVLDDTAPVAAGFIASIVFTSATIVQLTTTKMALRAQITLAVALTIAGLITLAVSVTAANLVLFVVGAVLAGGGVGILFRSSLSTAGPLAAAKNRGEALAGIYLVAYLGAIGPILLLGVLLTYESMPFTVVVFAVTMIVLVAICAPILVNRRPKDRPPQ